MKNKISNLKTPLKAIFIAVVFLVIAVTLSIAKVSYADEYNDSGRGERIVTIHDRGAEKVISTDASTIGDSLEDAGITVDSKDLVEPNVNEKLIGSSYQVNIYRARPVIVVDGTVRQKVTTPYQTAEQICKSAGIILYDEDITKIDRTDDVAEGVGLQLTIKRAIPFKFTLYGQTSTVRTQAKTVSGMLSEKNIKLTKDDRVSVGFETKIIEGMAIRVWREGKQTITVDESVDFEIEKVENADRDVNYREVRAAGVKGSRSVTYEIVIQDGKEVSRKEIASLLIKQPKKQVEVVGVKLSFNGDFAAALAKLRSCEGGYNSWNPSGPYYGAYQFDRQTWGTVADPARYGNATPAEQDDAAYRLYLRRGWRPWPVCGAAVLPDIYR